MTKDKSILIKNIYYMLAYVYDALTFCSPESIAAERFDRIHNLFAFILKEGIGRQIKQGLYRKYTDRKDDIPGVRGRIDMTGTIRNRAAGRHLISCDYDELSPDNLLNRILKTCVLLLLRSGEVSQEYKDLLRKEMAFFGEIDTVDVRRIPWADIRYHRNNCTYRLLIGLCRLLIEGMLHTTEAGGNRLQTFDYTGKRFNLYEKFILKYYAKEFPQLNPKSESIKWKLDDNYSDFLPVMRTDVTLRYKNKVLIIDAKYYEHTL
ncbi:MAG: 5-methylcytosine-specific restriction endonuclease system specificity protein McrC, partial [Prevotella sp.]|nr:5-methylcytosine-specific restriction endonuclease system specificity protein McrC [Prevotella sp.]